YRHRHSRRILLAGAWCGCCRLPSESRTPHALTAAVRVKILPLGEPAALEALSRERLLALEPAEMEAIRGYFAQPDVCLARERAGLGPDPTDVELEVLGQTWSEHCKHKIFNAEIVYRDAGGEPETIRSLFDTYIRGTTERVRRAQGERDWCLSVFVDNAGVVKFDDDWSIVFKVETHNHPSALEPYGGSGTGIGGVIRDPLGTGLGAKPILSTDVFCFGPLEYPHEKLPKGVLHPKRVMKGVVAGVRDYGNRMGIPTVNGSVFFDKGYLGNPVVYCGNVGLIPRDRSQKEVRSGDLILLIGGRTGRDGIHGATFSSKELTEVSETISSGAVQIGNPIMEKRMVDGLLKARDQGLYKAITDCGAGGLSSAVGEMGKDVGAVVDLEKVPLKYQGLSYTEIWISEAQERMVLSIPKENLNAILEIFEEEEVEATVIGEFTEDRKLRLQYEGNIVADLDMDFLHKGLPRGKKKAVWESPKFKEPDFTEPKELTPDLLKILSAPNVCSKEWVIRQYDHEVQGGSVLKPLVGKNEEGPGDACVTRPLLGSNRGIILSNGINPIYGKIDPYWMAAGAIDEALRNLIAVGGSLDQVALLDNFSWGNPDNPQQLGGLVRAAQACYDMAKAYGTPFISGKDSLNNEFRLGEEVISIPPTLLISALGIMEDVTKAVSMDAKKAGDLVYIVGETFDELGGSHYYGVQGFIGNKVPRVNPEKGRKVMEALSQATGERLVRACHDPSEGGIGVACAEMAFAGGLGMEIDLRKVPLGEKITRNDTILFSESNSRFIVEVPKGNQKKFEETLKDVPFGLVGLVTSEPKLEVKGLKGNPVVSANIWDLKETWQKPLRW
ncbi:phosphoribosylformylglycinamidine synthase subunit PurL, partial [candidate division TA06 bacterium]|nr:phosphoribosylformylglycinamidine synthase subunit PurL [candidate division TA06 bacterium]